MARFALPLPDVGDRGKDDPGESLIKRDLDAKKNRHEALRTSDAAILESVDEVRISTRVTHLGSDITPEPMEIGQIMSEESWDQEDMTGLPRPLAVSIELSSIPQRGSESRQEFKSEISQDRRWALRRELTLPELLLSDIIIGILNEGKDPSNASYTEIQRMEVDENIDSENHRRVSGEES